ncbi:MAG: hypothetical protein AUK16_02715 [Parcubacteria group bacterium CG2_30_44_11]|nr:MAG: hypothetical protein AUK16_02715 [Parcubacteria group bacterium CG2_30_44_11]
MKNPASGIINTVDDVIDSVEHRVDTIFKPVRKTAFEKFPTLFTLLVTFGLVATLRSFELLLMKWQFLYNNPWLLMTIGIGILFGTGTLYKKLG